MQASCEMLEATPRPEESEAEPDINVDLLIATWEALFKEVELHQQQYDKKMVEAYLRKRTLAAHDVRYLFEPGAPVLLRNREPGKMKVRAVGPYVFVKYTGKLGVTAEILNQKGKRYTVSACNLLPVQTAAAQHMLRYAPDGGGVSYAGQQHHRQFFW